MVTILDQLQMSKDKWLTVYDRSFLLMRKLITQLFETLAACSEGVMRFSEGLEYIFMSSKYYLDDLLKKIEKLEIYLHPTFEDDIKNRSPEYATRITIQLTDILETAQKLLNKIDELWTVKKCELINQIGLNICQYNRTDENDQKDNDETMKDDENFKQNESINSKIFKRGTFISTLRLNCSSQNVIQPKFYKQLYKILKFEINLYDLKLLLKSASDEFHELYIFMKENLNDQQSSGIFNWLNLTNSINDLEDVLCRLSGILTIQERNLIKLIDLNDLGISTFLHMIEKLKDNLNNEQEEEGPLFDLNKLRKTLTKWKDLMKLEDCDPLQSNSIMDKLSLEGEENSDRNDNSMYFEMFRENRLNNLKIEHSTMKMNNEDIVSSENKYYNETGIDDNDDDKWITSCFKESYQDLQNHLNDLKTKSKLEDIICQLIIELDYISMNLNINTCLTKYFKNQIDFEIWEQQRNETNLAKKEFIQALNNLLNEMYQNHSYKHSENVKTEFSKGNNKEEHEVSKSVVNNDLDHLRESNQDGFFCTDSIDYINRQMEAASERQKASFIKRKNLKDAIQQKQELKDKLEKEIEDIDQKLVELRKTLGDAFESMQLEVQHGKL
ncbi:putative DNA double-strand break repair rad50 ATPase [Schistosoma mansoni]|uniref:putative DNA double-strand break repair rad50 ATPase n=1 Tax=Schistosoma mansoni TaxID=6183 RepID=UPI0001A63654|nr:putative DNA double-strand break repair rad50 ATPase [Schistosoma mansoni]|eukprot:XP_018649110.1 putative DNA double-strand break repair rad50 ATPase [Schistosoma mansoni]